MVLLALAGCAASAGDREVAAAAAPPERSRVSAAGLGPGFDSASLEREFEVARGTAALERLRSAPVSVVAAMYQGLPRPITLPDGRMGYAGPAANAVIREKGRWLGWKSGELSPVPAAAAERLEAILADPRLWLEPEVFRGGGCTDAGSLQLAVRQESRRKFSRQDNCDSRGLAGELGRIVLNEAVDPT